ncbi:MAG TPA: hypothetical protein DCQ50_11385 [Chryseobacterium sp.]|nr:hypothetical protein [Chryseobacterium sp.]
MVESLVKEVLKRKTAGNIGFYASWARHCNISYLQIPASVPADEYLSAFVLNFINIFSISSGYRQTEY